MGDFRISVEVKVDLAPASASKAEQKRGYEHEPPLSMWLNYYPDRRDEIVESITAYLDKAWAAARWNLDVAYRESSERQALQDKIKRAGVLRTELERAEVEAEAARIALENKS